MATAHAIPPPPPPSAQPNRARWNTLQLLKANRLLLLMLDGVLAVVLLSAVRLHQEALRTVGQDAAPSMIAAQDIKVAIAAMDAEAAQELLAGTEKGSSSLANYEAERTEAANLLIAAAENITHGETERHSIRALNNGLQGYEVLVQRARDLHDEGSARSRTSLPDVEHKAQTTVDRILLPAADNLDQDNLNHLEDVYRRETISSTIIRTFVVILGLAGLIGLVSVQLLLSRRARRTVNLPLLAATVLLFGITLATVSYLADVQVELRVAKQDAFTSIHALWRARAVGYETAGDESRFLLQPANPSQSSAAFAQHAAAMAQLPPGYTPDSLLAAESAGVTAPGFVGFLADELNNITFPGEREAALRTLADWERYVTIDAQVRRLEAGGKHGDAVALSAATSEGGAAWALHQFDQSLLTTLDLNQRVFDQSVRSGNAALSGLALKISLALTLVAVLIVVGLAPRIREYQ